MMQNEVTDPQAADLPSATSQDKTIAQLSDSLNTQVTMSTGQAVTPTVPSSLPPSVSSLPAQFSIGADLLNRSTASPVLLSGPQPALLSSLHGPTGAAYMSPVLQPGSPPTSMPYFSGSYSQSPPAKVPGPPPKAGFQPLPHGLHDYESHLSTPSQQGATLSSPPAISVGSPEGVNIFTPTFDPNATPSPYSASTAAAVNFPYSPSPPAPLGGIHSGGVSATIDLSLDTSGQSTGDFTQQSAQSPDLNSIIEWIKTNETVHKMMQKAKSGVETVITAMDPQMKDVLYSGGDIDILVASSKAVKVEPVKEAFQRVFGRATVNGMDSQPGIAPQPVGFSSGIKGAEERISNLRRNHLTGDRQVCVAIESFIVDLQPEQWYDIACLMLSDPVHNITIQTFSQATPVSMEYVQQAQSQTLPDYNLAWSGLAVTVGQVMHRQCAVDPSDWHYYFSGISRCETLLLAAKQLAYIYKQRLPRS